VGDQADAELSPPLQEVCTDLPGLGWVAWRLSHQSCTAQRWASRHTRQEKDWRHSFIRVCVGAEENKPPSAL